MDSQERLKARIVWLILDSQPEEAIRSLCEHYHVDVPELKVGLPKKHSKVLGCYVANDKTIYVKNMEKLYDPFVILHECYHHLRFVSGKHRGTEKYADAFAIDFIKTYNRFVKDDS